MRIPELDGLRAIAILLVLGCHYELVARQFGGLLGLGWLGVDVFFALSGYLITTVLLNLKDRPDALRVFYKRRAVRILPPYLVALAIIYIVSISLGEKHLLQARAAVVNLFFLQSFNVVGETFRQVMHGAHSLIATGNLNGRYGLSGKIENSLEVFWSLSIEEYFYLLWAPVVLFCSRKRAVWFAVCVCAVEFVMRWIGFVGYDTYFSGLHRFDALMYGALVALAIRQYGGSKYLRPVLIRVLAGSVVVVAVVFYWMGPVLRREIRESSVFIVFGMPAIAILMSSVVGLAVLSTGHRIWAPLRCAPMRFMGRISYMLYLSHAPIYLLLQHFFGVTWGVTAISFGAAIAFCSVSWRYMEEPLLRPSTPGSSTQVRPLPAPAEVTA